MAVGLRLADVHCFNLNLENTVFRQEYVVKPKVHDVLVKINMGRKRAASSEATTQGLLRETGCI